MFYTPHLKILFALLLAASYVQPLGVIQPTADVSLSVLNYGAPTIIRFSFQLTTKLLSTNYMFVTFPAQWETVTPRRCKYGLVSGTQMPSLTATCTTGTTKNLVYVQFSQELKADQNQNYILVIELVEEVPTVLKPQMSGIFKLETHSTTDEASNTFDRNPVFGMVPITAPKDTFDLVVKSFSSTTAGTTNLANAQNDLLIQVSITTTTRTNARIKVILQSPWLIESVSQVATSQLQVSADNEFPPSSLIPPVIQKIEQIGDNEFNIIFATPLVKGQIFMLTIPNIKNPGYKVTGGLFIYLMETNSNSYVASFQSIAFFSVSQYIITLDLTHPNGIPMGTAPMNYYRGKYQGFKLSFKPPQSLPIGSIIKISLGGDNIPVEGSLFISIKSDDVAATELLTRPKFLTTYQLYKTDGIVTTITVNEVPAAHVVHLIFRVILTSTADTINPSVSIWTEPAKFKTEDPLYYGSNSADVFTTTSNLVRYWNQNGQISLQGMLNPVDNTGGAITLEFNITTKSNDAGSGSKLEIYLPKVVTAHAGWSNGSSCTTTGNATSAMGTFANCTIVTNSQYTIITLPSGTGNNYFFSVPTAPASLNATATEEQYYKANGTSVGVAYGLCTELCPFDNIMVTVQNLVIDPAGVSNFQNNMYDIFMRLYNNDQVGSGTIDWVGNLVITSQLTKYTDMSMSFGQKLSPNTDPRASATRETDTRSVYRPSWVHVISSTKNGPAVATTAEQKKIITIFAKDSFQKLLYQSDLLGTTTDPLTGDITYPCSANLADFKCLYVQGAQTSRSTYAPLDYFLDYDRVHIIFSQDTGNVSVGWHVILPTLILADSQEYYALTGTYNTLTEEIIYEGTIGNEIFSGTFTNYPATEDFQVDLNIAFTQNQTSGKRIDVTTKVRTTNSHLGNSPPDMGAALVVMTDWELWYKGISGLVSTDVNTEIEGKNMPLTLNFKDFYGTTRYFTYIPLINPAHLDVAGGVDLILKNVFLPYSHDINSYYLYTLSKDGQASTFYSEMNLGQNFLKAAEIITPTFSCVKQYVNLYNLKCELEFTPNNMIQSNGILQIQVNSGYIATDKCTLEYSVADVALPVIDTYTCSTNNDILQIFLNHGYRLPELTKYKITFWGLDTDRMVQGADYFPNVTIQIRDSQNTFVIEEKTITDFAMSQTGAKEYILISGMVYEQMNAKTVTTLVLSFEIPRDLYPNEEIFYRLGIDLESANLGNQRILMTLYNDANTLLDVTFVQTEEIIAITWDKTAYPTMFTQGTYSIRINGLITPTSHKNGIMSIYFKRTYDSAIVLSTDPTRMSASLTFSEHPLTEFAVSGIEYFTEGLLGQISFKIRTLTSLINPQNRIFFFFPTIFSPTLTNSPELLTCKINSVKIPCQTSEQYPYRLELYQSPIFIQQGTVFTLTIYGLQIPEYLETQAQQIGYIGISSWNGLSYGNYYTEQGEFSLPTISSFNAEHQFISLFDLRISDLTLRASVEYTVDLSFDTGPQLLPYESQIFISFPNAYTLIQFFNDPLPAKIYSKNQDTSVQLLVDQGTCVISGLTLIYKVTSKEGIVIEANERMVIVIQNLPNPQAPQTLNPNEIQIKIFSKLDALLFVSNYQINLAMPIVFPALRNTFKINNNQPIIVTAGTYTDFMDIQYSEGPRFLSDVQLTLTSQAFKVVPNKVDFTRGDTSGVFKIGADPNLFLQGFPIFIQKLEALGKNAFQNYDNLKGFISYEPIVIQLPTLIQVAYGGSSLLHQISLQKRPFNDIELLFLIDFNKFGEDLMIDSEFSSPSIQFDYNSYLGNIQVSCEGLTIPAQDYHSYNPEIQVQIHGTNDGSYSLSSNSIRLEIIEMRNVLPEITLAVVKSSIAKVEAIVEIKTNQPGIFFYQMGNVGWSKMSYLELKAKVVANSYIEVDEGVLSEVKRFGMIVIEAKSFKKTFSKLQTETNYFVHGYFVQQFKVVSNATYTNFTTLQNAAMRKISFQFSESITLDTLNYLLCFLSDVVITPRYQIFTSDGFFCSVSVEPDVIKHSYTGQSETTYQLATNLYFQSNPEYEVDPAMKLLESFIPVATKIPTLEFYKLGNASDIGYLNNVTHKLTFKEQEAKLGVGILRAPIVNILTYKLTVEQISAAAADTTQTATGGDTVVAETQQPTTRVRFTLDEINLSGDGKFFFIIEKSHIYYEDPQDPGFWEPKMIYASKAPTPQQIFQCQNWKNVTRSICGKIVITNNQIGAIDIQGIEYHSIYQLYYVTANEYPLTNVLSANVSSLEVKIFSLSGILGMASMFWIIALGLIGYLMK